MKLEEKQIFITRILQCLAYLHIDTKEIYIRKLDAKLTPLALTVRTVANIIPVLPLLVAGKTSPVALNLYKKQNFMPIFCTILKILPLCGAI